LLRDSLPEGKTMDSLNSTRLTTQDGFIHAFRREGEFRYSAPAFDFGEPVEAGIIIIGGKPSPAGKGKQFDVVFHWDSNAQRFVARESDRKLSLRPNDFVVFHFDVAVPGQPSCFVVVREKKDVEADSRRLKTDDVFTHFFFNPGEYAYRLGGGTYRISVADPRAMSDRERQQPNKPLVIVVKGEKVSEPSGKLVAGQTAVWVVEKGEGLQIQGVAGSK
jgi:hypothetical protein